MRRLGLLLAATALVAVAGCSKSDTPAPTFSSPVVETESPAPTDVPVTASPGPTSSVTARQFTVDGAGPYQLGATLTELQSAGLLADVKKTTEVCPGNTGAKGTGQWSDINMSFRPDGKLYIVINRSTAIPTPSGAWLGNTLPALKDIYKSLGQEIGTGSAKAFLVTTGSGRGILFDLDPATQKVISMIAGDGAYLKQTFTAGTDAC